MIDATNDFDPGDLDGRTSSEVVADLVAGARLVKAANTLGAAVLAADPHEAGGQRVLFLSGDDADAKSEVAALFDEAGFSAIDLGGLSDGGEMQQVHGPLAGVNLIRLAESAGRGARFVMTKQVRDDPGMTTLPHRTSGSSTSRSVRDSRSSSTGRPPASPSITAARAWSPSSTRRSTRASKAAAWHPT